MNQRRTPGAHVSSGTEIPSVSRAVLTRLPGPRSRPSRGRCSRGFRDRGPVHRAGGEPVRFLTRGWGAGEARGERPWSTRHPVRCEVFWRRSSVTPRGARRRSATVGPHALPDRGWSCSGLPPAPRAARIEPRFGATGAGSRMTARCPLPRRRTAVHVPNGPGSSSRAPTLASVRLRRFTRPWRVAPLQSRPACFIRSRSWGLGVGRDALLEGSRDGRPEGPSTRSVPHGVLRFARNEVRRGGPASAPSLANQGRDAGCSTGSLPPGGPALCQALSRLTESAALAPDVTGVPSRVETVVASGDRDPLRRVPTRDRTAGDSSGSHAGARGPSSQVGHRCFLSRGVTEG
jgi:hypothetical protein